MKNLKIVLASASPRRKDLLRSLGWSFEVLPAEVAETAIDGEEPSDMVERLSLLKGRNVAARCPDALVIASDTIVVKDGQIYGKPRSGEDALRMLSSLSGSVHIVHSGLALLWQGRELCSSERTGVRFRKLDAAALKSYVATGEPFGKAGAYAIQGLGSLMVQSIEGSYSNVVGLPLCLLGRMMEELGFSLSLQWEV